jgi:hypothetical protein
MSDMGMLRHLFNSHHDDSVTLHGSDCKSRLGTLVRTFDVESRRNRDLRHPRVEGRTNTVAYYAARAMNRAATSFRKTRVDTIKYHPKHTVDRYSWFSAKHFVGRFVRGYYAVVAIDKNNRNWNALNMLLQRHPVVLRTQST